MGLVERFSDVIQHDVNQKCTLQLSSSKKISGPICRMPVYTNIVADDGLTYVIEEENTIRIFDSSGKQVGFYSCSSTKDLIHIFESYKSPDGRHEVIYISYGIEGKTSEEIKFKENTPEGSTITTLHTIDGKIVSASVESLEGPLPDETMQPIFPEIGNHNRTICFLYI